MMNAECRQLHRAADAVQVMQNKKAVLHNTALV
jgi:hypothetical protein